MDGWDRAAVEGDSFHAFQWHTVHYEFPWDWDDFNQLCTMDASTVPKFFNMLIRMDRLARDGTRAQPY